MKSVQEFLHENSFDANREGRYMAYGGGGSGIFSLESLVLEYAKLYANNKLEQAAENAKMIFHCGHSKENRLTKYHQIGADNLQIDKRTILDLREDLQ